MEKKFELGPLQKMWVQSLREHPERQMGGQLGEVTKTGDYKACCLGELLICASNIGLATKDFKPGYDIKDTTNAKVIASEGYLSAKTAEIVGLHTYAGALLTGNLEGNYSLASANDNGVSWTTIADYVETHPENIFKKSV